MSFQSLQISAPAVKTWRWNQEKKHAIHRFWIFYGAISYFGLKWILTF